MDSPDSPPIRIGIDIGGTFTDFVIYSPDRGEILSHKVLSTPQNPALAVLSGIKQVQIPYGSKIIHGSTVATNAVLERKGAKTALITTQGFKDLLVIGRQNRPALYDWTEPKPAPLIPPEQSYEVDERVDSNGHVLKALNPEEIKPIVQSMLSNGIQSVAISLLFSFLYPRHEQEIAKYLRSENIYVSLSSEIIPEYREYERTSTTAVNAYVSPLLDTYLSTLKNEFPHTQLQIMQSNGGMISIDKARETGVRCILCGPAGGVIGAQYLSEIAFQLKDEVNTAEQGVQLMTFDMGGTSTDVSLLNRKPTLTTESSIGGCPISIATLDIHTIGAGGGSIAYADQGGALRVGPQSAGADPGPACYGRGEYPTVTDANLVLGRLAPEFFMGGKMPLNIDRSWKSIEQLGSKLGMNATHCAMGIVTVANTHMEHALRVISIERGYDPRDFTLFSFGGAGGLHAVELARNLKIPRILISPYASVLSAFGMLAADIILDYVRTVMLSNTDSFEKISLTSQSLIQQANKDVLAQGIDHNNSTIEVYVDARYQGQSYELTIPFNPQWDNEFHKIHQKTYGYHAPKAKIELVNIRVRAIGYTPHPIPAKRPQGNKHPHNALIGSRDIITHSRLCEVPCYQHDCLEPGNFINGPAMIVRPDTTVIIDHDDTILVDDYCNLWVNVGNN